MKLYVLDHLAPHELESTIHISHSQAQERTHRQAVDRRVKQPQGWVLPTHPVARYNVRLDRDWEQSRKLIHVELPVRISEKHPRQVARAETRPHGGAVPEVARVADEPYLMANFAEFFRHPCGTILAPVVNYYDLRVAARNVRSVAASTPGRFFASL